MILEFVLDIPADTSEAEPEELVMDLPPGNINKVEVIGDGGEHNMVKVIIRRGLHQVFPINMGGQFHPGFFPISFNVDYDVSGAPWTLEAYGWSPDTTYDHQVIIRFGMRWRDPLEALKEPFSVLGKLKDLIFGRG